MASIRKRTTKDGKTTHTAQIRLKGFPPQTATFERVTDARKWVQQTEAAIRDGRHFKNREPNKRTLSEAIQKYDQEILSLQKNPVNQRTYLKWWREQLGYYALADITPSLLSSARNRLLGSKNAYGRIVGPITTNRYMQCLGHVLNVAMREWQWVNDNPTEKIKKYKEKRGRVRFLSDDERKKLLDACKSSDNPHLYNIVVLALSTGARKMEIVGLRWSDIDFTRGRIVLLETKNGERRSVPLQGYAKALMIEHANSNANSCEYVFPSERIDGPIDIRTAWENAVERAGIEDFRFHDLRHSCASYLAMNSASLTEIADVLGHKTLQMVKRYAHLSETHTNSIVASMNDKIFAEV